jgi:galactonate dehydratase
MARLDDPKQVTAAQAKGYRAFTLAVPARESMTRLQAYVDSVRRKLDDFKKAAGDEAEVVLDGAGALLPGDAAVVARAVEREHPVWFDEPTAELSRDALSRFVDETTVPIGLGRHIHNTSEFQNLLRLGCVDVIRPSLALNSLHQIRRLAAIAESHYIAVAPHHDGGPLATMLGIHLGASLSNFYVQEAPFPASERDRAVRSGLLSGAGETGQDGFAPLVNKPGLGVRVDEEAVGKYAEETL